jgi:adenylate cyclase
VHAPVPAPSERQRAIERELARRAADSERLRLTVLGGFGAFLLIVFPIVRFGLQPTFDHIFRGQFPASGALLTASAMVLYAMVGRWWTDRLRARGDLPPRAFRFVAAAVETSLPTAGVALAMSIFGPVYGLLAPPAAMYILFIALSALHLDFELSVFTGVVAAVGYGALAAWGIAHAPADLPEPMLAAWPHHLGKAAVLLASGVLIGVAGRRVRGDIVRALQTMDERDRVVRLFGEHVSPEVVDRLLAADDRDISEVREVCVLFLDIRDFTTFSEAHSPQEVVDHLNTLFAGMVDDVNAHGGIVNKFLGDGFMAVFGAPLAGPDACSHGVAAARGMLARLDVLNATAATPTRIGIGLHAGSAITGHVGSARRREYTVIGDVVNVASRIEGLNKQFGSSLLISDEVRVRAGVEDAIALGPVAVNGRDRPIAVWKLA